MKLALRQRAFLPGHRFEDEIATVQALLRTERVEFQVHKQFLLGEEEETRKPGNEKQVAKDPRFSYQPFLSLKRSLRIANRP